jgi:hypothetical protein
MCVIAVYEKKYPTLDELHKMELVNRDGGGLAWREKKLVCFKKGLTAKEIYEIIQTKELPIVVHFRAGTSGGVCPELCHPFPVSQEVPLLTKGKAQKVLFHNGIWQNWRKICLDVVTNWKRPFISGKCSDTRAMAWLVSIVGESVLNLIHEKVVIFTPKRITFYGEGWVVREGVVYSNIYWENDYNYWRWNFKNRTWEKGEDERI